ncbi:hypothetical protein ASPBRDRAFT_48698 [Aspergillus brasiliensis CBS 101740]|uniref:Uncharacterized protein n=1 Tax=Aspergillus brasiliensis (strain CBS 101740 / IMI 381727 / IBT 21946) TaxID=767769 RepID=A0A1L9U4Z6_ASPBC|nr:hypothetical protein ASPBRDRAFT_48698 [Aspergillus brasiliensis CBS 101740]
MIDWAMSDVDPNLAGDERLLFPSCIIHPSIHPSIHPPPNPPFPSSSATLFPIPLILRSPLSCFYNLRSSLRAYLVVTFSSSSSPFLPGSSCPSLIYRNGPSHCRLSLVIPFPLQAWVGFTFYCLLLTLVATHTPLPQVL